jgi:hypothetical protein
MDNFERTAKLIYRQRKTDHPLKGKGHPNEEELSCFLEGKLSPDEIKSVQRHLVECDSCARYVSVELKTQSHLSLDVPESLIEKIRKIVQDNIRSNLLEIVLSLKEGIFKIVRTTGDVLLGQELVPAPVLRSREISEFKGEVNIIKDLRLVRILVKIRQKSGSLFDFSIEAKDRRNSGKHKNLRVSLFKEGLELESYLDNSGIFLFENLSPGDYLVETSCRGRREAMIELKVTV